MIDEQGMTEEELERTRAAALSSRLLAMQSNGTLCQMLALDILFGLPLEAFEQQTGRYQEYGSGPDERLYQEGSGSRPAAFLVHRASACRGVIPRRIVPVFMGGDTWRGCSE